MISSIISGDLDLDGWDDIVFVRDAGSGVTKLGTFRSLRNGAFEDATGTLVDDPQVFTGDVALGDVDLDGDLDVITGRVLVNRHVQTFAPALARPGHPYRWEHWSEGLGQHDRAITFVSLGPRVQVPGIAGTFGLDLATTLMLPAVTIPPGVPGVVSIMIPPSPAVRGITFYSQALFTSSSTSDRGWGNVSSAYIF